MYPHELGNIPIADEMWRDVIHANSKDCPACDDFAARYCHLLEKGTGVRPRKTCSIDAILGIRRAYEL